MNIFYYILDQRIGPVSRETIVELKQRGTITPDTVLEISGKRIAAGKVKGLFGRIASSNDIHPVADFAYRTEPNLPPVNRRSAMALSSNQMKSYARSLYQASESLSSVGGKYSGSGKMLLTAIVFLGISAVILGIGGVLSGDGSTAVIAFIGALIGIVLIPILLFRHFRISTTGKIFTFLSDFGKLTAMQYLEQEEPDD